MLPFSLLQRRSTRKLKALERLLDSVKEPFTGLSTFGLLLHIIQLSVERLIVLFGPVSERLGELDLGTCSFNEAMHSLVIVLRTVGLCG